MSATCGGVRVHSVYVPNGRVPDSEHYHYKLAWLAALGKTVGSGPQDAMVCGDMNIAPADIDVFDPGAFVGQTHVTPPERAALAKLQGLGLHDVVRDRWPTERVFTYWDYRAGMFHQDRGMRIDLVLATADGRRQGAGGMDRPAGPQGHQAQRPRPGDRRSGRGAGWGCRTDGPAAFRPSRALSDSQPPGCRSRRGAGCTPRHERRMTRKPHTWSICPMPRHPDRALSRRADTSPVTRSSFACARGRALPTAVVLVLAVLFACCSLVSECALAASPAANWDSTQQRQVVAAGLMGESGGTFDGAGRLTANQANAAMATLASRLASAVSEQGGLGGQASPAGPGISGEQGGLGEHSTGGEQIAPGVPDEPTTAGEQNATGDPAGSITSTAPVAHTAQSPVTVVTFDRMLVEGFGLTSVAAHVQETAATAGLRPPSYFGSEVVARMLELRYEHPVGSQRLDLFPGEPITRAEAAWSLARVLQVSSWNISSTREALSAFELPQLTAAQRQALQIAVSRIGYPYVWGGTTDNTADGLEHGGFDCSGFAWRVFKVSGLPWGRAIRGRTAAEQAGEIPQSQRLSIGQLEPGDLLFFGSAHFNSKATESNIIHEGIYLGDNWVIHSSGQGVYVLPLSGSWLGSSFAWGRRVID